MPWVVVQENQVLGTSDQLPGQENTERAAFNRCLEQYLSWMQGNWGWQGQSPVDPDSDGGDVNNPSPGRVFKTYFRTETLGDYHIEARWTYLDPLDALWKSNQVFFRAVFV